MTAPETSPSRARDWLARGAFLLSTLALLGTSKPPVWTVEATITGPRAAPADRGLVIAIESSTEPKVAASGSVSDNPFSGGGFPCASRTRCLLPPEATLDKVVIEGGCGGCTHPCAPPPGAFVRATTSLAPLATETSVLRKETPLPVHKPDWTATEVMVGVVGAELVEVGFRVETKEGAAIVEQRMPCRYHGDPKRAVCPFYITDDSLRSGPTYAIVATATGWSACSSDPCAPPKTLRIVSMEIGAK